MKDTILRVGDVVRLKIGGPKMSIATVDEHVSRYMCHWFNKNNELTCGNFHKKQLVLVADTPDDL